MNPRQGDQRPSERENGPDPGLLFADRIALEGMRSDEFNSHDTGVFREMETEPRKKNDQIGPAGFNSNRFFPYRRATTGLLSAGQNVRRGMGILPVSINLSKRTNLFAGTGRARPLGAPTRTDGPAVRPYQDAKTRGRQDTRCAAMHTVS
jgi:hypothetical protein